MHDMAFLGGNIHVSFLLIGGISVGRVTCTSDDLWKVLSIASKSYSCITSPISTDWKKGKWYL